MDSAVVVGDDVPTRLRLPGGARGIPAEEVGSWRIVGGPNNLLLFFREVSSEADDAFRTHPDAPVRDLNVFEDVGNGELLLVALRSFVRVGGKGSDIDEPGDTVIGSCGGDIAFVSVEALLGGHHFVPICLKRGDHLAKARAICPDSVAEDDARFGLRGFVHSRTSLATAIVRSLSCQS